MACTPTVQDKAVVPLPRMPSGTQGKYFFFVVRIGGRGSMWLVVAAVQILNNIITCEAFIPTNPVVVGVRRVQTSKVFGGGLQFPATQCIYVLHLHPEDTIDETAAAMRQVLEGAGHQPLAVVAFHGTPQVRRASGVASIAFFKLLTMVAALVEGGIPLSHFSVGAKNNNSSIKNRVAKRYSSSVAPLHIAGEPLGSATSNIAVKSRTCHTIRGTSTTQIHKQLAPTPVPWTSASSTAGVLDNPMKTKFSERPSTSEVFHMSARFTTWAGSCTAPAKNSVLVGLTRGLFLAAGGGIAAAAAAPEAAAAAAAMAEANNVGVRLAGVPPLEAAV